MDREQALEALKLRVENPEHLKHSFAVEAVMRELARLFHEDAEQWGLAGLVHNIDVERINKNTGMMSGDILEGLDFDETIVYAVRSHNSNSSYARRRRIDKALYCSDSVCKLIMACVKTLPSNNLKNTDKTLFLKCYYDKNFVPDIIRDQIAACSELELDLESFIELSINALKEISGRLE